MTEINQSAQKLIAWSKEHPALAVGLVAGAMITAPPAAPVVAAVSAAT